MKNELLSRILKNSPTKNTSILSESVMFQKKDVIPTDVPIINIAFSGDVDGGLSSGLTLFAGPSRNFKSMLALICAKAFLDKYTDSVCILYDSEGGITPEYLRTMDIDPDRVVHIPIEHIEMLKFDLVKQLKEITREDKVIILIDSIGNVASLKELDDALNEKSVAEMQRAKSIKGLFRMVTPSLIAKDVPCIAVCHTYSEMSLYPKQIISGGTGLMYACNQAFIIGKVQEKEGTDLIGYNFIINIEKSRFVKEKSKFPFTVTFDGGIQKYSGLMEIAIDGGFVMKPSPGWYAKVDKNTGESGDKMRLSKTQNEEFWKPILQNKEFKEYVKQKYEVSYGSIMEHCCLLEELGEDNV